VKLLPKLFRAGAGVLSPRIDELGEDVHALLDGGLDADNLSASYVIPLGHFAVPRSLLLVRGVFGWGAEIVVDLPFDCRLLGVSAATSGFSHRIRLTKGDGTELINVPLPGGAKSFFAAPLDHYPTIAGGERIISDPVGQPGVTLGLRVAGSILLDIPHEFPPIY
jgi:hypothetical protein